MHFSSSRRPAASSRTAGTSAIAGKNRRAKGEGAIKQRADGRWEGRVDLGWSGGSRVRRYVYGRTSREVQDQLRELVLLQRIGNLDLDRSPHLGAHLEHWLELVEKRVRIKTAVSYRGLARRHIIPALGRIRLDELKPQHVERLILEKSKDGLSPTTVHRILQVLRMSLGHAVRTGALTRNVAQMVAAPRLPTRPVDYLAPNDARELIKASRDHRIGPLVTLCLTAGLRQGEALGLH